MVSPLQEAPIVACFDFLDVLHFQEDILTLGGCQSQAPESDREYG